MIKKFVLFILVVIVLSSVVYFLTEDKQCEVREKYNEDFTVLASWYGGDTNGYTKNIFDYIFSDVKYKYKNALVYTMGAVPDTKDENNLYVQYSGESWYADATKFDINFFPALNVSNNVIFLYGLFFLYEENMDVNKLLEKRVYKEDKKFCLFCVSNGGCEVRNNFFNELCKYKKVDSCGRHLNNMDGFRCPGRYSSEEYYKVVSDYKFMICFENGSHDYYFTEKLLVSYLNNTIPIYWGCPQVAEFLNMDAIFYLKPEYTEEDVSNLINEIIKVDSDETLYKQKFEQPLFVNNKLPDLFLIDKIKENVNRILK